MGRAKSSFRSVRSLRCSKGARASDQGVDAHLNSRIVFALGHAANLIIR